MPATMPAKIGNSSSLNPRVPIIVQSSRPAESGEPCCARIGPLISWGAGFGPLPPIGGQKGQTLHISREIRPLPSIVLVGGQGWRVERSRAAESADSCSARRVNLLDTAPPARAAGARFSPRFVPSSLRFAQFSLRVSAAISLSWDRRVEDLIHLFPIATPERCSAAFH